MFLNVGIKIADLGTFKCSSKMNANAPISSVAGKTIAAFNISSESVLLQYQTSLLSFADGRMVLKDEEKDDKDGPIFKIKIKKGVYLYNISMIIIIGFSCKLLNI